VSRVERPRGLREAVERAARADGSRKVVVERWLEGVEITVPVLGNASVGRRVPGAGGPRRPFGSAIRSGPDAPRALPVIEIVPREGAFFDYRAKYTPGASEEIVPARLASGVARSARALAVLVHEALGCEGLSRTDMIVVRGRPIVLECNTLPGMTDVSLFPKSARAAGIELPDLCARIVDLALARFGRDRVAAPGAIEGAA
jgi:D-alanine-D-alanine ligase